MVAAINSNHRHFLLFHLVEEATFIVLLTRSPRSKKFILPNSSWRLWSCSVLRERVSTPRRNGRTTPRPSVSFKNLFHFRLGYRRCAPSTAIFPSGLYSELIIFVVQKSSRAKGLACQGAARILSGSRSLCLPCRRRFDCCPPVQISEGQPLMSLADLNEVIAQAQAKHAHEIERSSPPCLPSGSWRLLHMPSTGSKLCTAHTTSLTPSSAQR